MLRPSCSSRGLCSSVLPVRWAPQLPRKYRLKIILGHQNVHVSHGNKTTHSRFTEPLQENLLSSTGGKRLLFIYAARNFLPCIPFFYLASFTESRVCNIIVFLLAKPQAPVILISGVNSVKSESDEKLRALFCFCFALQLRFVKMLGWSPLNSLKIRINQQLGGLMSPSEVQ